jgi:hypothetical protein
VDARRPTQVLLAGPAGRSRLPADADLPDGDLRQ